MINIRYENERGVADHGWLKSQHSFSFANYYDPRHMGVSVLRVINDDLVAPGAGFPTHSHRDMEILSYIKQGTIEHKDSMGNIERVPAGEFQLMSAGTGVTHSEYNPSQEEQLSFLQIWIKPNAIGLKPKYQQRKVDQSSGLHVIASPNSREGAMQINQDATLYHLLLDTNQTNKLTVLQDRKIYVHMVSGSMSISTEQEPEGVTLSSGDGATLTDLKQVTFNAQHTAEALVFDLP